MMSFDRLRMSGPDKLRMSGFALMNPNPKPAQAELVEARAPAGRLAA
jgi:hypothetical protein